MPIFPVDVKFEWDNAKNTENILKHGLDFADAWQFSLPTMLTALDTKEDYGEDRDRRRD